MSDLGEISLCRLRGEGVRLRRLLTSPFLAPGPDCGLLGPSSSEEEDPVSVNKMIRHQQLAIILAPTVDPEEIKQSWGKGTASEVHETKSVGDMDKDLVKEGGLGKGEDITGKKKKKKSYNLKKTVDSACDTGAAAAPNLLLPLFHFYPPLKRRVFHQCSFNQWNKKNHGENTGRKKMMSLV